MLRKLEALLMLICMMPYATAGTVTLGTANVRGNMRVDSSMVNGNATLFDGSVVETNQASADLRLNRGVEITMATSSRATVHRDRLVLQYGESELAAASSYSLEANGLRVTPNTPNSRGVVSFKYGNTVEVASLTGDFGVTNAKGILLANVGAGRTASFAIQQGTPAPIASAPSSSFSGTGMVSFENGHYYIELNTGTKYELVGKNLKNFVGKKVQVSGSVQNGVATASGAGAGASSTAAVVTVSSIAVNGAVLGASSALIIGGIAVAAGTGLGVGIYQANQSSSPASR